MSKVLNYYYLPTAVDTSVSEVIVKQLSKLKLEEAELRLSPTKVNSDGKSDKKIRDCLTQGIPADHWVSGMLSHFVNCANTNLFHFDLYNWASFIHLCVYNKKGSHYDWHTHLASALYTEPKNHIRKLSISMCLSSKNDYDGGEFQLYVGRKMFSFKMDRGDAIIFPSDCMHRVRRINSGSRKSLVGWYGGPPFR